MGKRAGSKVDEAVRSRCSCALLWFLFLWIMLLLTPDDPARGKALVLVVMVANCYFQADKARATSREVEKEGRSAANYAKGEVNKLDRARHDAAKEVNAKIDSIDQSVEKKASEAKSGISSWFGGGKKD